MPELGNGAKADTPGCTTQACSIRDAMPDLKSLGIAAVGISPADTVPLAREALGSK